MKLDAHVALVTLEGFAVVHCLGWVTYDRCFHEAFRHQCVVFFSQQDVGAKNINIPEN